MFGRKQKMIEKQQREINELKRRLFIAMNDDCRTNNHKFFIVDLKWQTNFDGYVESWTERLLECKCCGKRVTDSSRFGYKYKLEGE
jgi:hypothetical protein